MTTWTYINDPPNSGEYNMTKDADILAKYLNEQNKPVFRIYQWDAPTISLGRFQNAADALYPDVCSADGVAVVQRMTGGGAIYHTPNEITYSLACHDSFIGDKLSVKETYKVLCGFILEFYRRLGFKADFALDIVPPGTEILGMKSNLCFAAKEEYDIVINGHKIGGNAQKRVKHVIFQHGSIPLTFDGLSLRKYIRDIPADIDARATSLRQLGVTEDISTLRRILRESFESVIGQ
ncbi:MAG: lipoate--protein ligase family protein [Spirochaetales bacterium]|nr:lipoate--protein ligase family protein [Spirochaetales bacterium]